MKYNELNNDEMVLRDFLAADRTSLANERTLLSYIRTFIGLFGGAIALINITDYKILEYLGFICVFISPVLLVFGFVRYLKVRKHIKSIK